MTLLENILTHNETFVQKQEYEPFATTKFPNKKLLIVTCMDTRLLTLLPQALGLQNGDAKVIKNAGAVISHPFGSMMRSIILGIYELQVEEICVIGHEDCGMAGLQAEPLLEKVKQQGIDSTCIRTLQHAGIDLSTWLTGFRNVQESVQHSVEMIRQHPLLPSYVPVHGLVIHPKTGNLEVVVEGYSYAHTTSP
ncbi:beta-class carbonic anhydrase [Bacillus cereus]|uniref:beta-class carbonic anhydrase n=1 Tax=Bacillus cereus TaxID=1396 RepID=UPI000BF4015D|nr:carbonic anhydrase [Bacillus cereus]PEV03774.1 carbonic anhydrase [Bacillus cereus]PGM63250.1 carbonic anhydrase [Bacillus cereus]HDR8449200.1 carbonic anhydrase [Bacillus cereus]HDR8461058.1 carbonic anhydrase [Bacillus cereus]